MSKVRLLVAIIAMASLAACGDLGPTAPQDRGAEFGGFLGSGGGG